MRKDLEDVFNVNLERVDMGDCRIETVLQIEIRLQLSWYMISRCVLQVEGLLPEFVLADLKRVQYFCNIDRIRGDLLILHVRDERLEPIDRVHHRRTLPLKTVCVFTADRGQHTRSNWLQLQVRGGDEFGCGKAKGSDDV